MLGRDMVLHCDEWKQLSPSAKILYLMIKAKHNGTNNGTSSCTTRTEGRGGFPPPLRPHSAFKELEKKGWITKRDSMVGCTGSPNKYKLTGRYDDYICDRSHTVPGKV